MNVKIKALSFVLMAALLLCGCEPNEWGCGAADLYGGNENIRFEGCVFRQMDTYGTYAHLIKGEKQQLAEQLEDVLSKVLTE